MGYILKNMEIFGKKYGIYWDKTIGYFMGYMRQKLRDIFDKNKVLCLVNLWVI